MHTKERDEVFSLVHDKYVRLYQYVNGLGLKKKRMVYQRLRQCGSEVTADHFLPDLALTVGEWAVLQKENCVSSKPSKSRLDE